MPPPGAFRLAGLSLGLAGNRLVSSPA